MKKIHTSLLLVAALTFFSCKKTDNSSQKLKVPIGALLSLTGNWSDLGQNSKAAIGLAISDINASLQESGSPYVFESAIYDTGLDTGVAARSIQDAKTKGIRYFVGPQSSAELGAIKPYADANGMVVVSQGSTASSLAIANDGIFRFCPGDAIEGAAIAQSIRGSGVLELITTARSDAGNIGLQQSVGKMFTALGGTTDSITPYATTLSDFTGHLAALKTKLQAAINANGAEHVGVYLASFDECVQLFRQASNDPVLGSVAWYGGDGVVLSNALIADPQAAAFAVKTGFFAPNFGLPLVPHVDLDRITKQITQETGRVPDAYALAAYDATMVIARSIVRFPTVPSDVTKFIDVFRSESSHYYGITGPLQLNAAGDRSNGSFDYFSISQVNGKYQWIWSGKSY